MSRPPPQAVAQCDHEPNDLDKAILEHLADTSACTPRSVQLRIDKDVGRSWVCRRLKRLSEDGPVEKVDRGLYTLQL